PALRPEQAVHRAARVLRRHTSTDRPPSAAPAIGSAVAGGPAAGSVKRSRWVLLAAVNRACAGTAGVSAVRTVRYAVLRSVSVFSVTSTSVTGAGQSKVRRAPSASRFSRGAVRPGQGPAGCGGGVRPSREARTAGGRPSSCAPVSSVETGPAAGSSNAPSDCPRATQSSSAARQERATRDPSALISAVEGGPNGWAEAGAAGSSSAAARASAQNRKGTGTPVRGGTGTPPCPYHAAYLVTVITGLVIFWLALDR